MSRCHRARRHHASVTGRPGTTTRTATGTEGGDVGVLQRFERRIEEMVNRPFARAFKAEVQPVEIASALQRECDDRAAIVARGRTMVPNVFTVALGDHDHDRLSTYAEALGAELAAMVSEYAEEQHYAFLGPVNVEFERDSDLETGRFRLRSMAVAAAVPASQPGAETTTRGRRRAALRGSRWARRRTRCVRPPRASAAAPTATYASMTPASRVTTPRSASRAAMCSSSTPGRPTAS